MKRKAILKASIKNIKFSFLIFFILTVPKVILTQKIIAIHFYEMLERNLDDNEIKNYSSSDISLEFVNKTPIQFNSDSNTRVSHIFFIDLDIFYLDFSREEEVQESQQYNIYININIVNYDEIVYFYNIVMTFPNIINSMDEYKYCLILNILDILKIKTNKKFEDFIRLMSASLLFNTIETKEWKVVMPKNKKPSFSSVISKKVIVEFFKLYIISEEILEKITNNSNAVQLRQYFSFDFIDLNEDYFYLDNDIIQEILKIHKISKNFIKILDFLFSIHTFYSIFLSNIFYTENFNLFFDLSLFKTLNKIFINRCSNTDILIEKIINVCGSRCIKTLNIIYSQFTMKNEIVWLKKLDFKAVKYFFELKGPLFRYEVSNLNSSVLNIFSRLIDEIYKKNKSNIFLQTNEVSCYDQEKTFIVQFHQERNNLQNFKTIEPSLQGFIWTKLFNSFLSFDFYNINFKELRNIQIKFEKTCIKDFELPLPEVLNNICRISVCESTFSAVFLSKILMFPFLKTIWFAESTITSLKNVIDFNKNSKIEKFHFGKFTVNDQYHFVKFLNHMIGLKILDIFIPYNSKDANIFTFKTDDVVLNFTNLKSLSYKVFHFSKDVIPIFPIFSDLQEFNFGSNYPKGTLHRIFNNNNFRCLKKLTIYSINVGKEDESALEKYTSLLSLCFEFSKFSKIFFFNLFNSNNVYSLIELKLPDIEINYLDMQFIAKLKDLKKIYMHRLPSKVNIIHFLKFLSSVRKIKIEKLSINRNELYEEYGEKIQKVFCLTYFVNLDI